MTIPLWKLNRELRRIGNQILGAPYLVFDIYERLMEPFWRYKHRKEFNARVSVDDGQVAETQRIVIFLIYQPEGVAQSTISLCENMIALGFSPFIVSNAPLSPTDRDRIDAVAWKVMERPNFGYDFGGYQDALFVLRDLKETLEYLIIMNDSVWLEFTPDLWERLVAEDKDVVGLVQESKLIEARDTKIDIKPQNLQSYFFLFNKSVWNASYFWSFWSEYKMTSSKRRTIRFGEVSFTSHLNKNKVKTSALISKGKFIEKLIKCNSDELMFILNYSTFRDKKFRQECNEVISNRNNHDKWHEEAFSFICKSLIREPLNGSFWVGVCQVFDVTLIKKHHDPLNHAMRQKYLAASNDGAIFPLPPNIATELATSVKLHNNSAKS
ncbi:rhamnan synthesis F family protein [Yoonia sp.]|uniref:rhamnan synthesis F family protein n=1 Tax=Yoonia sp. TaxID=2212373 RepID=UPI0019E99FF7|nr:rhamnan synthesis F family protein [Yoonia sp.]MBE0412925.1 hypothetical protein [Yoonia sp.]